jgi:hypothetical protein
LTLKTISIENVKGIGQQTFDLDIIPNKPSILVAPNGFGKSSFATAFESLNANRLKLSKEHFHLGNEDNLPKLELTVDRDGVTDLLVADANSNTISNRFDIHVLSSRLKAKAITRNMGGFTSSSASLVIEQVVLVDKIPVKAQIDYSVAVHRKVFGKNGKILKSIDAILSDFRIADTLLNLVSEMKKLAGVRHQKSINDVISNINEQMGTSEQLMLWAEANVENALEGIQPLTLIADAINCFNDTLPTRLDKLLGAFQIFLIYSEDTGKFKKACQYSSYLNEKNAHEKTLRSFDTTWKRIKPKEHKGKLVVDFPQAIHISNGQRDSLSFAAWLQKVVSSPSTRDCIIVIDEVFDYLDDANLVAVQYYISNLIKAKKATSRHVYPLILTHLNPLYFRNFTFNKQKVYFLKKYQPAINPHLKKLIVNRKNSVIEAGVDRHHLHYDPSPINLRDEFKALGLKETWGDSTIFRTYLNEEWEKYLANLTDYDPFAVCCFARVKIEEIIYNNITQQACKTEFLDEHGTKNKLEKAESFGVTVDDTLYLLGVIYNEGMHIHANVDNSSPIVAKLENLVIRKMLVESLGS